MAPTNKELRLLLLCDDEVAAQRIQAELELGERQLKSERAITHTALALALCAFEPQVVLFDSDFTGLTASEALLLLQGTRPEVPFIVLGGMIDPQDIVAAIRAGAEGVVLKSDLRRLGPVIDTAIAARKTLTRLTSRQLQILRLIAEGHTTPVIAQELELSTKTVETHRSEIMKRLEIHDLARLVRFAVRVGIVSL